MDKLAKYGSIVVFQLKFAFRIRLMIFVNLVLAHLFVKLLRPEDSEGTATYFLPV